MTALIIGLIAALGVGGGIALSGGHGGGGGGSSNGGGTVYEETIPVTNKQPDIISILATADRYKNTQTVMTGNVWEDYITVKAGDGKIEITSDAPIVNDGKFAYSVVDGGLEDTWGPYSVEMTKDDYQKSDKYADYYSKNGGTYSGLYNMKDWDSEADNWVQEKETLTENLALGGNVLGLKNSDFGYHQQNTTSTNFGSGVSQVNSFYMYDDTKLASESRFDKATFSGNLLGGIEAIDNEGVGEYLPYSLTGTATATIDFTTNNLLASLNTRLNDKTYHTFNATGFIDSPSSFSISTMEIDNNKSIDTSLAEYKLSSVLGNGSGKILADDTQTELVGQLDFWGKVAGSKYDELVGNLAFGMIERGSDQGTSSGETPGETPNNPSNWPTPNYNLISALTDIEQYPDVSLIFPEFRLWRSDEKMDLELGNEKFILTTTIPLIEDGVLMFDNDTSVKYIPDVVNLAADNLAESTDYEKIYQISRTFTGYYPAISKEVTITKTERIGLAGSVLGLSVSDFGYWEAGDVASLYYIYAYDNTKLATTMKQELAYLKGYSLPNHFEVNLNVDFRANAISGNVYDILNKQNVFDYTGNMKNANFNFEGEGEGRNFYWGQGNLLLGKNGLEAVGRFYFHNHYESFGAKEVK